MIGLGVNIDQVGQCISNCLYILVLLYLPVSPDNILFHKCSSSPMASNTSCMNNSNVTFNLNILLFPGYSCAQ